MLFRTGRRLRRALFMGFGAALVALTPAAAFSADPAASSDPQRVAVAQALYEQAVAAMEEGRYEDACPKLEEVVRIEPSGLGAKLTLAQCYEGAGRLASAWTMYALIEAAAALGNQPDRRTRAHDRAEALRPRLARLVIDVPDATRALGGVVIHRDGEPVGPVQWGVPLPIDRGRHVVAVVATGKRRWERVIEVSEDAVTHSIEVGGLLDAQASRAKLVEPHRGRSALAPAAATAPSSRAQRTAGIVAAVFGLTAVGVGVGFGAVAAQKQRESNENGHCHDGNRCDDVGTNLRAEGWAAGFASTTMFITGGIALAGGVTLFATAPHPGGGSAAIAMGPGSVEVRGAW